MIHPRLIPVILLKNGLIVRSQTFTLHQDIGNPMSTVERYAQWNVDELVLLDISRHEDRHDLRRDDLFQQYVGDSALDVLGEVAKVSFMPLTFGGRVRSVDQIEKILRIGADKIAINTKALGTPDFITEAARRFGSQCIVASIDIKRHGDGRLEVFADGGRIATGRGAVDWAREVEARGAGEIFLNSIDRDGTARGYDLDAIRSVTEAVKIPVIACGGVGTYGDLPKAIAEAGASAAAAANIFHFFEVSYPQAKQACIEAGLPMRPLELGSKWFEREPVYDRHKEDERLNVRLEQARGGRPRASEGRKFPRVQWCTRCLYPSASAAPMEFDDEGVCSGCRIAVAKDQIPRSEWDRRWELLKDLVDSKRSRNGGYDCVLAASGGKDSYFIAHVLKKLGLRVLIVTYDANNWTEVGWRNMRRMREAFGFDHTLVSPSVPTLVKLNKLAFEIMGDMNWHAHVGIMTVPVAVAAQHNIPLVFYGEHGYLDLSGQFSMYDFPEISFRDRLEHFARGYEWNYFVGREGLTAQDMELWKYPSDKRLFELDLRGIFLGNYVFWEANEHLKLMVDEYGFELSEQPFDRTYRRMSNLDDMHENGVHDYLKWIKFGYGRCTDHVCKDIRAGRMTREQGAALVRQYDHVKPRDLARWLDYVGMTEDEFDRIADTFRDPRVWRVENGVWTKDNIWDTHVAIAGQ